MNNNDLKTILSDLDSCIDEELPVFFSNSSLKLFFSKLIEIIVLDYASFSDDIINKLDILTDDLDSFNFNRAKCDIEELYDLL